MIALGSEFGGLRFVNPQADFVAGNVALWLPAVSAVLLGFLPRTRTRFWCFVGLTPFAALGVCLGVLGALFSGFMPEVVNRQLSIRLGNSRISTYYSSTGALDDEFVKVQQEIPLLPGLLWVQPILNTEGVDDVKVKVLNRHHVQCDYTAYKNIALYPIPEAKRDVAWVF